MSPARNPLAGLEGRHFISTQDLNDQELKALLDLAEELARGRHGKLLEGKVLGMVFFNPSLRTRTSFEAGTFQLGGHAIHLAVGQGVWKLEHRDGVVMDGAASEHLKEAVPVLARYCDLLAVRCFPSGSDWKEERKDPVVTGFADHSPVPLINMESSLYHPCQGLADMLTVRQKLKRPGGKKFVLAWTHHPKALPTAVPNSAALIAGRSGMDLALAHPKGYELDPLVMRQLQENADRLGTTLEISHKLDDALDGAHVVYAKSWGSLKHHGNEAAEKKLRSRHRKWIINGDGMARTDGGIFMHCLPVRRNVVVTDEVLDSPASVVVDQAENRLHVQKALMAALAGRLPRPATAPKRTRGGGS